MRQFKWTELYEILRLSWEKKEIDKGKEILAMWILEMSMIKHISHPKAHEDTCPEHFAYLV